MSSAHWHLALVHVPVLFVPLAVLVLIFGLWWRQVALQRLAALLFIGSALVAIPVFLTGEPAEEQVEELPQVSESAIEVHEEAAELAFYLTLVAGGLGLGALLTSRRPKLARQLQMGLLAAGIASSLGLLRAASLGGLVRHSEIRDANAVARPAEGEQDIDEK